ncbi:MAG: diacylglycerol kinase family lipid kinase [Armatimonadetes bacterium]|nr:diacylglycerol kinase family lipid kinase [Armatimonadota bacterium]
MRTLVICSPVAGGARGAERFAACRERLQADVATAERAGHAEELARASQGYDCIIAAGGDGTVHEVANGLLSHPGLPPRLAILPLGTGNDIARNLGILDIETALAAIQGERRTRIDLVRVDLQRNGGPAVVYAVLNVGVGFGAAVVRATTVAVKRLFGQDRAYLVGTLRALAAWRSPLYRLRLDEGELSERLILLGVANGEYEGGGRMRLSPGARMDDGRLELLLIRHGSKLEVLRNLGKLPTGDHIHHRLARYQSIRRLEVAVEPEVEIAADGDVVGRTPAVIEVVPAALEVAVP